MSFLSKIRNKFLGSPPDLFFESAPVIYEVENPLYNLPTQIKSVDIGDVRKWNVVMSKWTLVSNLVWYPTSMTNGALFNTKEEAYAAFMKTQEQPKETLYTWKGSEHLCLEE